MIFTLCKGLSKMSQWDQAHFGGAGVLLSNNYSLIPCGRLCHEHLSLFWLPSIWTLCLYCRTLCCVIELHQGPPRTEAESGLLELREGHLWSRVTTRMFPCKFLSLKPGTQRSQLLQNPLLQWWLHCQVSDVPCGWCLWWVVPFRVTHWEQVTVDGVSPAHPAYRCTKLCQHSKLGAWQGRGQPCLQVSVKASLGSLNWAWKKQ